MTKIALITDTHFGMKKGSQIFHDYFEKFYNETFFPTLDARSIDTVIHLGDVFDVRKGIDYWSLDWAKRVVFQPLYDSGIETHIIVGNHDIFYRQSLKINAPALNLNEFTNIITYAEPTTANIRGTEIFMIPWVCEDNADDFVRERDASKAKVAMGHLEVAGFYANSTYQVQHGLGAEVFSQFDQVFSGHYHKKNGSGNILYLGNPYQMYWNDYGDTRGFHIYDTETGELEFIPNKNEMFHKIYYNEDKKKLVNHTKAKNCYVKLIVEGKSTPARLNQLIDKLYKVGIHDLKVIENTDISIDDDVEVEAEDTLTTLTNYVNAMEDTTTEERESLIGIFKSLYVESQEV